METTIVYILYPYIKWLVKLQRSRQDGPLALQLLYKETTTICHSQKPAPPDHPRFFELLVQRPLCLVLQLGSVFWWLSPVRLYSLYNILYPKRRIESYSIIGTIVSPNKISGGFPSYETPSMEAFEPLRSPIAAATEITQTHD